MAKGVPFITTVLEAASVAMQPETIPTGRGAVEVCTHWV